MQQTNPMRMERRRLADLIPAAYNPRKALTPEDPEYQDIKASIQGLGYADSIVINYDGTIIKGHQRRTVIMDMGIEEAEVVVLDIRDKAMKTQNATESSLTATINVTGEQLELKDFKVSPATYRTGQDKPDVLKAKVLLSSSLKGLMKSNNKAFLVKFRNGHVSVAQRYHKTRYPIKKLLSNSIPTMIGSKDRVYGVIEPEIYDTLMDNILKEIKRVTR